MAPRTVFICCCPHVIAEVGEHLEIRHNHIDLCCNDAGFTCQRIKTWDTISAT
ncbi:MAG: hypothetical protein ABW185_23600 [Sedimenticola sp.]